MQIKLGLSAVSYPPPAQMDEEGMSVYHPHTFCDFTTNACILILLYLIYFSLFKLYMNIPLYFPF